MSRGNRWYVTRVGIPAAAVVTAAGVGIAFAADSGGDEGGGSAATTTTTVTRRTLVDRESFDGTLGYASERAVINQRSGTVTRLPDEGTVRRRGQVLYRVDDQPVVLMYGATPAWRPLDTSSADGPDVRQLELNLVTLGHDPDRDIEVDDEFDWATEAAVERWQEDLGVEETGAVELGQVAFLPAGARRVGTVRAELGATVRPGRQALQTTSTDRSVTVQLDARRQDLAPVGSRQRVELPGGRTVPARVSEVGAVARAGAEGEDPTVTVTLGLTSSRGVTALDSAPVDVQLGRETAKNALAVPTQALLALAGGGFGLEVAGADGGRVVAVKVGTTADGYAEVSGAGIDEGTRVVMPA